MADKVDNGVNVCALLEAKEAFNASHPEVFAAGDNGATPVEYVLVGLPSCLMAGVASVAQNREIQLRSVEAKLEGNMKILGISAAIPTYVTASTTSR